MTSNTLSTREVAELANVDVRTVRYWMDKKGLPGHYEGAHALRFYEKDVQEFLAVRQIKTCGRKKKLPSNIVKIEKPALALFDDDSEPCEVCQKPMIAHEWVHMDEEGNVIHCSNVKES